MNITGDQLRQKMAEKQVTLYKALRADESIYSIGSSPPSGPFVYFCGTFTTQDLAIHQTWMAELRHLLRAKGYTNPICLPDERMSISSRGVRNGTVWQNRMLEQAADIVFSLDHLSHQEEVFTTATLAMVLAHHEAKRDKNIYVYDSKKTVSCLQLRFRLGAAGIETHQVWSTLAKAIMRNNPKA